MKIAISGTTGLIGGTLYQKLCASGGQIIKLGRNATCDQIIDFSRPDSLEKLDLQSLDAVVHAAGVVDEDFKTHPVQAWIQSSLGVARLLDKCVQYQVPYFVYFSTAHVYGDLVGELSEATPPNPLSDYAIAHYVAEQTIRRYALKFPIKALILRPCAVYGLPTSFDTFQRWFLTPFSFPIEAVYHQKIVLRSAGQQQRNFVDTQTFAPLIVNFLQSAPEASVTVMNPQGAETLSVYDFALRCAKKYQEVAHQNCQVERVSPTTDFKSPSVHFLKYDSIYRQNATIYNTLDAYLETFIQNLVQKFQKGRLYGDYHL